MKAGYVYILSGHTRRLYIGVTSDLERRVWEHKQGLIEGFTKTYSFTRKNTLTCSAPSLGKHS